MNNAHKEVMVITKEKRILHDKSQDVKDSKQSRQNISKREHTSFPADGEMYLGSDATLLHSQSLQYYYKVKFA